MRRRAFRAWWLALTNLLLIHGKLVAPRWSDGPTDGTRSKPGFMLDSYTALVNRERALRTWGLELEAIIAANTKANKKH